MNSKFRSAILLGMIAVTSFSQAAPAAESGIEWSGLAFKLTALKTNFVSTESITVSIVVSNTTEANHPLRWSADNPCHCGLGYLAITNIGTGKSAECQIPDDGGVLGSYLEFLKGHKSKTFEFNIATTHAVTNAGTYSVQAIGWFPIYEPPTNRQYATIITPPIFIRVLPRQDTNSPPKSTNSFAGDTNQTASACSAKISIRLKDPAGAIKTNEPIIAIIQIENISTNETLVFRSDNMPTDFNWAITSPSGKNLSPKEASQIKDAISGWFPKFKPMESREEEFDLRSVCTFDEVGTYKFVIQKQVIFLSPTSGKRKHEIFSTPMNINYSK